MKYLVENSAEVNAVPEVRIDMYNITYRLCVVIVLYSFQQCLCLCWLLLRRFDSQVIKRVNYVVGQGTRLIFGNEATIIMYFGTQCHTLHLIAFSCYFKILNNVDRIME